MHVTQVHRVTTENQFHCTRLYTLFALICPKFMDSLFLRFRPYLPMFCFFFSIQNKYGCGWAGKPSDGLKIYWNSRIPQPVSTQPRTAYSTVSSTRVEATTPVLGWRQCGMAKQIILFSKKAYSVERSLISPTVPANPSNFKQWMLHGNPKQC